MIVPASGGPKQAMKRGMLKAKAKAVARRWVGNSSGNHVGIQANKPWQKNAFTAATASNRSGSLVHRNRTGVMANAAAKYTMVTGLRPNPSARKPKPT